MTQQQYHLIRILILLFLLINNIQAYKCIYINNGKISISNLKQNDQLKAISNDNTQELNAIPKVNTQKLEIKKLLSIMSILTISINPLNDVVLAAVPVASRDILADQNGDSQQKKTVTLPSGVKYYDEVIGDGLEATEGRSVQFQWVLRRSNGYFVDSSANYGSEPFVYKVGNLKKTIKGVDEGIRGMKVNGIRRMAIPPSLAFVEGVEDGKPGPLPADFGPKRQILTRSDREVWYFEIKLTKVK